MAAECRLCWCEATPSNRLVVPCLCRGSIAHAHTTCLAKHGAIMCGVCRTNFFMYRVTGGRVALRPIPPKYYMWMDSDNFNVFIHWFALVGACADAAYIAKLMYEVNLYRMCYASSEDSTVCFGITVWLHAVSMGTKAGEDARILTPRVRRMWNCVNVMYLLVYGHILIHGFAEFVLFYWWPWLRPT